MRRGYRIVAATVLLPLSVLVVGCAPSPGSSTVNVTLQEWSVLVDDDSVPAGEVTFAVANEGPGDVHEFVVIRTLPAGVPVDVDAGALPADATGAVDEASSELEVIDEIEDIAVGDTQELTVTLEPGNYVLVCNIYTEDEQEAHYAMGMRSAFTVEGE